MFNGWGGGEEDKRRKEISVKLDRSIKGGA